MLTQKKRRYIFSAVLFLFLCLATGVGFILLQNSQDTRQQASTSDPYSSTVTTSEQLLKKGVLNTSYTGDRAATESDCGGLWMNDFCYMPGDEFANGKVVVAASDGKKYAHIEDKAVYERGISGSETIVGNLGSTASLGENCGGKGLNVDGNCYAYGSTINGYQVLPARTSNCDDNSGNYCYPHLQKVEVNYDAWKTATNAYKKTGDLASLEALYKQTYGIDFNGSALYDTNASNANVLKAQAILSSLTSAAVLQEQAKEEIAVLEAKESLTQAEQATLNTNKQIVADQNLATRYQTLDQLNTSTAKNVVTNSLLSRLYNEWIGETDDAKLEQSIVEGFKQIYGYDPASKYSNANEILTALGLNADNLNNEREKYENARNAQQAINDLSSGKIDESEARKIALNLGIIDPKDDVSNKEVLAALGRTMGLNQEQASLQADKILNAKSTVEVATDAYNKYANGKIDESEARKIALNLGIIDPKDDVSNKEVLAALGRTMGLNQEQASLQADKILNAKSAVEAMNNFAVGKLDSERLKKIAGSIGVISNDVPTSSSDKEILAALGRAAGLDANAALNQAESILNTLRTQATAQANAQAAADAYNKYANGEITLTELKREARNLGIIDPNEWSSLSDKDVLIAVGKNIGMDSGTALVQATNISSHKKLVQDAYNTYNKYVGGKIGSSELKQIARDLGVIEPDFIALLTDAQVLVALGKSFGMTTTQVETHVAQVSTTKKNQQAALDAYNKFNDGSITSAELKKIARDLGVIEPDASISITDKEVLISLGRSLGLDAVEAATAAKDTLNAITVRKLSGNFDQVIKNFATDPVKAKSEIESMCSDLDIQSCDLNQNNGTQFVTNILSQLCQSCSSTEIADQAISVARTIRVNSNSYVAKLENQAAKTSSDIMNSMGIDYEQLQADLQVTEKSLALAEEAGVTDIFTTMGLYDYASANKDLISDYNYGLIYGDAYSETNTFSSEELGFSFSQQFQRKIDQVKNWAGVDVSQNIATNLATSELYAYTGPADTRTANTALTGLANLGGIDSYQAATYGYYVSKTAQNTINNIAATTAGVVALLQASSKNQTNLTAVAHNLIDDYEYIDLTETFTNTKNKYLNQATDKTLTTLYDNFIAQGGGTDVISFETYNQFSTDSEIIRSAKQLDYETTQKLVIPTVSLITIPTLALSGVGLPTLLGLASSGFSAYQGAGLKAQALELQRIDIDTRENATIQMMIDNGESEEEVAAKRDEIQTSIDSYNKQANMMFANSAVAGITSFGGALSQIAQKAATAANLAQTTVSTSTQIGASLGQALTTVGRASGLGLSTYTGINSTLDARYSFSSGNTEKGRLEALSAFTALAGTVGNTFGFTGSTAITNKVDLALDVLSGGTGGYIDMKQVAEACYGGTTQSEENCTNAWIGLALSVGQDISQVTRSYKTYQTDVANAKNTTAQNSTATLTSKIDGIFNNATSTLKQADLDDLTIQRQQLSGDNQLLDFQLAKLALDVKSNDSDAAITLAKNNLDALKQQLPAESDGEKALTIFKEIDKIEVEIKTLEKSKQIYEQLSTISKSLVKQKQQVADIDQEIKLSTTTESFNRLIEARSEALKTVDDLNTDLVKNLDELNTELGNKATNEVEVLRTQAIALVESTKDTSHIAEPIIRLQADVLENQKKTTLIADVQPDDEKVQVYAQKIADTHKNLSEETNAVDRLAALSVLDNKLASVDQTADSQTKVELIKQQAVNLGANEKPSLIKRFLDIFSSAESKQTDAVYQKALDLTQEVAILKTEISDSQNGLNKLTDAELANKQNLLDVASSKLTQQKYTLSQAAAKSTASTADMSLPQKISNFFSNIFGSKTTDQPTTIATTTTKQQIADLQSLAKVLATKNSDTTQSSLKGDSLVAVDRSGNYTQFKLTETGQTAGLKNEQLAALNQELAAFEQFKRDNGVTDFKIYSDTGSFKDQDVFILAEVEALGAGNRGTIFGALPGMGKTDVVMPFNILLKQKLTNDPQVVVFSEAKLMKPWTSDENYTPDANFIKYVESRFGEGSVLIVKANDPNIDLDAIAKAKFIITTKEVAFDLQSTDTEVGAALFDKWQKSYIHADEADTTFDPNQNFRVSSKRLALTEDETYSLYLSAQKKILGIDENGQEVNHGMTQFRELLNNLQTNQGVPTKIISSTADGKSGKFIDTDYEKQILTEWVKSWNGQSKITDFSETDDVSTLKAKIDQYLTANTEVENRQLRAESAYINTFIDFVSKVPGGDYGITKTTQSDGKVLLSVNPYDKGKETGQSYSGVLDQLIYNSLGAKVLGVDGQIKMADLTSGGGGSEINYAQLMLKGKGYSLYTGTPETVAKLYKMAFGIESRTFTDSAVSETFNRFAGAGADNAKIFTSAADQIAARVKEDKNQVFINMVAQSRNNSSVLKDLVNDLSEAQADIYKKLFVVGADGSFKQYDLELKDGKLTLGAETTLTDADALNQVTRVLDDANSRYVKFYEYGAHVGVDTKNNVDISHAVGLCYGCDETTFAQGINRVRVQVSIDANNVATNKAAPIDIVYLDAPENLKNTAASNTDLLQNFKNAISSKQITNEALAEVQFKETLLQNAIKTTFTDLIDLAKNGKKGLLGISIYEADNDLAQKLEKAQQKFKEVTEMNYRLSEDEIDAQTKLQRTAEQVAATYKELEILLKDSGEPAKLLAQRADGALANDSIGIKFTSDSDYQSLGSETPSYRQIVELINGSSLHLQESNLAFTSRQASGKVMQTEIAKVADTQQTNLTQTELTKNVKNLNDNFSTPLVAVRTLVTQGLNSSMVKTLIETPKNLFSAAKVKITALFETEFKAEEEVSPEILIKQEKIASELKVTDPVLLAEIKTLKTEKEIETFATQRQVAYQKLKDQFAALNTIKPSINNEKDYQDQTNKLNDTLAEIKGLQDQSGLQFIEIAVDGSISRVNQDQFANLSTFKTRAEVQIKKLAQVEASKKAEQAEQERIAAEKEQARLKQEALAQEQAEKDRQAQEETDRLAKEAADKVEQERIETAEDLNLETNESTSQELQVSEDLISQASNIGASSSLIQSWTNNKQIQTWIDEQNNKFSKLSEIFSSLSLASPIISGLDEYQAQLNELSRILSEIDTLQMNSGLSFVTIEGNVDDLNNFKITRQNENQFKDLNDFKVLAEGIITHKKLIAEQIIPFINSFSRPGVIGSLTFNQISKAIENILEIHIEHASLLTDQINDLLSIASRISRNMYSQEKNLTVLIKRLADLNNEYSDLFGERLATVDYKDYNEEQLKGEIEKINQLIEKEKAKQAAEALLNANQGSVVLDDKILKRLNTKPSISDLTQEEIQKFNKAKNDSKQSEWLRSLLSDADFFPKRKIVIEGITFYFLTDVLNSADSGGRLQAILYSITDTGKIIPRSLYKSNSDGGWRSTPYSIGNHYSKGWGKVYTQETKLHDQLNNILNELESNGHVINKSGDLIKDIFSIEQVMKNELNNFKTEISIYDDGGTLANFQKYPPGYYTNVDSTPTAEDFKSLSYPDGFIPDFTKEPIAIEEVKHTLLGHTILRKYIGVLNGRQIIWVMASDDQNRVWIDRIYFVDSKITSYGTYNEIINSGALTNKPLEYISQIYALNKDLYKDFDAHYKDITPLLENLKPIQLYRQAVGASLNNQQTSINDTNKTTITTQVVSSIVPSLQEFSIGRNSGSIEVNSKYTDVSRNHAILSIDKNGNYYIRDVGSKYGTFVNNEKINPNVNVKVTPSDKIILGSSYQFVLPADISLKTSQTTISRFSSLCSDCNQVRLDTQAGVEKADTLIKEAEELFKQATDAKNAKDQSKATDLEKQAQAKQKEALAQLNNTRSQVINSHGMQNQCVQLYLNAWVDTKEAEIRKTTTDVNQAITAVYQATVIAENLLANQSMEIVTKNGFLGIGQQKETTNLDEEDLTQVETLLSGGEDVVGLKEMAEFETKNGHLDKKKIVGGILQQVQNSIQKKFFLNNVFDQARILGRDLNVSLKRSFSQNMSQSETQANLDKYNKSVLDMEQEYNLIPLEQEIGLNSTDHIEDQKYQSKTKQETLDKIKEILNAEHRNTRFLNTEEATVKEIQAFADSLINLINQERLAKNQAELPKVKIYVSLSQELNAYALPDGSVVVYQGLINALETKDQLYAVLTHEISHFEDNFLDWAGLLSQLTSKRAGEYKADMTSLLRLGKLGYQPKAIQGVAEILNNYSNKKSTKNLFWEKRGVKVFGNSGITLSTDLAHGSLFNRNINLEIAFNYQELGIEANIRPTLMPDFWKKSTNYGFLYELNTLQKNDYWEKLLSSAPTYVRTKYYEEFIKNFASIISNRRRHLRLYVYDFWQTIYNAILLQETLSFADQELNKFDYLAHQLNSDSSVEREVKLLWLSSYSGYENFLEAINFNYDYGLNYFISKVSPLFARIRAKVQKLTPQANDLNSEYLDKLADRDQWTSIFISEEISIKTDPTLILSYILNERAAQFNRKRFYLLSLDEKFNEVTQEFAFIEGIASNLKIGQKLYSSSFNNHLSKSIEKLTDNWIVAAHNYSESENKIYLDKLVDLYLQISEPKISNLKIFNIITNNSSFKTVLTEEQKKIYTPYLRTKLNLNDEKITDKYIDLSSFKGISQLPTLEKEQKNEQLKELTLTLLKDTEKILIEWGLRDIYETKEQQKFLMAKRLSRSVEENVSDVNDKQHIINYLIQFTLDKNNFGVIYPGDDLQVAARYKLAQSFLSDLSDSTNILDLNNQLQIQYMDYLKSLIFDKKWQILADYLSSIGSSYYIKHDSEDPNYLGNTFLIFKDFAIIKEMQTYLNNLEISDITQDISGLGMEYRKSARKITDQMKWFFQLSKPFESLYFLDKQYYFGTNELESQLLEPLINYELKVFEEKASVLQGIELYKFYENYYPSLDNKNKILEKMAIELFKDLNFADAYLFLKDSLDRRHEQYSFYFLENHVRTVEEYKTVFTDKNTQQILGFQDKKMSNATLFDTFISNYLTNVSDEDAFGFFEASITGNHKKVKYYLAKYYSSMLNVNEQLTVDEFTVSGVVGRGIKSTNNTIEGVEMNENGELIGPGATTFPTFNEFVASFYNLSKLEKTAFISKLLAEKILLNEKNQTKIAVLLTDQLEDSKEVNLKPLLKNIIESTLSQVEGSTKIQLGISKALADSFLQGNPGKISNKYAIKSIIKDLKNTKNKKFDLKKAEEVYSNLLNVEKDVLKNQNAESYQFVFELNERINSLASTALEKMGIEEQQITLAETKSKIPTGKFITELAKSLGSLGVRFLQVFGQYFDLPKELQEQFLSVYDDASNLYMANLFQSAETAINTLSASKSEEDRQQAENIAKMLPNLKIIKKIGGGSINTTYLVEITNPQTNVTETKVLKISNPNVLLDVAEVSTLVDSIVKDLEQIDKKNSDNYQIVTRLMDTLKQWNTEDILDKNFISNDILFKQSYPYQSNHGFDFTVSKANEIYNRWIKVEDYVEGDTLKNVITQLENKTLGQNADLSSSQLQKAKRIEELISDIVSDYTRHFNTPVTLSDGTQAYVLHSDLHIGNVMTDQDLSKVSVIDRSYYLVLNQADVDLIKTLLSDKKNDTDWVKFNRLTEYLLKINGINKEDKAKYWKNYLSYARVALKQKFSRHDSEGNGQVTFFNAMMQETDKLGLSFPLNVRLFMKNMAAINKMLSRIGDDTLSDYLNGNYKTDYDGTSFGERLKISGQTTELQSEIVEPTIIDTNINTDTNGINPQLNFNFFDQG